MMEQVRMMIQRRPRGEIVHRGRELLVFRRDGYQRLVFKGAPNLIQGWQSLTEPMDFRSEFVEMQLAASMCIPRPKNAAVLGLGLGTVPRSLAQIYPPVSVEAVELRREVVDVAKKYFGLTIGDRLQVKICDAQDWIQEAPTKGFNAVYVDLFSQKGVSDLVLQPSFMIHLQRIVRPGGLICFNLKKTRHFNITWVHCLARNV